jgi:hypothetical protein
MPVVVAGLKEAQKAMRALQPELDKELKREVRELLNPVVKKAKSYVPDDISGLSHWMGSSNKKKITAETSMFRIGKFPKFNATQVKAGIRTELFPSKRKSTGFTSLVRIVNLTAAGAIFETAGRKNPNGQPWDRKSSSHDFSRSLNPKAGAHFIEAMGRTIVGDAGNKGRLIYRAWHEDQGRALGHVMKAIEATAIKTAKYVSAAKAFRKAA